LHADANGSLPHVAPTGLSRARLYAFHAAVASGVAATSCGSNPPPATLADAALDRTSGVGADAETGTEADAGGEVSASADAGAGADAANDAVADASADVADATDANLRDWGPIPLPYGCVFPEGDEVTV
jgi:hypothetical protein